MSTVETFSASFKFNRRRTLDLLDKVAASSHPETILRWRPGPGRAHIGWQLLHIAITEELFATERLQPEKPGTWTELWPRFQGGSTPDDELPSIPEIRQILHESRVHLRETLATIPDSRLAEVPYAFRARNWTFRDVLHVIGWHEGHHQGQAHLTWNLYQASLSR